MQIEARGLAKRFGEIEALRGLDFSVPAGRRVALVGPNGSGKSTLNRVLLGLLAFEGEVLLDGCSPLADRVEIARRMAYVPQVAPQLAAPVGELVTSLARVRGIRVQAVADATQQLGLELAAVAPRPFRSLSGGMKQKLLIGLALAAQASLLLLDEPTGSLDARSRELLFPLLADLPRETTLVLCSHRLEEVRQLVDHVLVLHEGSLVYDGEAAAFLDATAMGLVEVCAAGAAAERWLGERGFRRGSGDWWRRVVPRPDKRELVAALAKDLAGLVSDVNVRDLEWLEPGAKGDAERGDG